MTSNDAIEFIIAGASTLGIGTALFYDPLVCPKINSGISQYLIDHQLNSVNDLVGTLNLNSAVSQCDIGSNK
jgi:dihydroorotate dehydrogenase (NAD+) catalytic subunit